MFTEDYQVEFLREHHHVFDDLSRSYLSGEMVWNFADFMTGQSECLGFLLLIYVICYLFMFICYNNCCCKFKKREQML